MTRKIIEDENVMNISNMKLERVIEMYQEFGACVEVNDGLAYMTVWEGVK